MIFTNQGAVEMCQRLCGCYMLNVEQQLLQWAGTVNPKNKEMIYDRYE